MFILLVLLWILLNGKFTLEILIFGIVIAAAINLFMVKFMDYNIKRELLVIKNSKLIIKYLFTLVKEIFKANFMVIKKIIFLDKEEPSSLVKFDMDFKSEFAQIVLANSITITPGTITVKVKDNFYIVHGLSKEYTDGITESEFVKQIKELEEKLDVK